MLPRVVYYRSSALNRLSPLAACARSGDTAGVASLLLKGINKNFFSVCIITLFTIRIFIIVYVS
jgi:hypothetical protein